MENEVITMVQQSGIITGDAVRAPAVAGAFYPADAQELESLIDRQMGYARALLRRGAAHLPSGCPKAVIVPHAGYVYSGTTAALAYALLERGRGTVRRAVIVGPTHRVAVRGVACCTAGAFATPLGRVPVDVDAERRALDATPSMIVNDATHMMEHAVEVQVPFLQRIFGETLHIVPLNAGDATPRQVGDVIRALWGGPETVIIISSDLSHYHPQIQARSIDDQTIARIAANQGPISPNRACGAYPVNGLLDVCAERDLHIRFLGCSTSGDNGEVALADVAKPGSMASASRPVMQDPFERVVGYAAFALWEGDNSNDRSVTTEDETCAGAEHAADATRDKTDYDELPSDAGPVLLTLARTALATHLGIDISGRNGAKNSAADIAASHPWLERPGASFVTLREGGELRGCIGTLEAWRPLGRDVADHAVDAAVRDPRFKPVTPEEYPLIDVEVSVLSQPHPLPVQSRDELENTLRQGEDGLIIDDGYGHRATFLPQVWQELPHPTDFVSHLLRKAGLRPNLDWNDGRIDCARYTVTAFSESR